MIVSESIAKPLGKPALEGRYKLQNLVADCAFNGIGNGILAVSRLLITVLIARTLGPTATGRVAYAIWICDISSTIFGFGAPSTLSRYLSEFRGRGEPEKYAALCSVAPVLFLAMLLGVPVVVRFSSGSQAMGSTLHTVSVTALFIGFCLNTLRNAYLAGAGRFRQLGYLNALTGAAMIFSVGAACLLGNIDLAILALALSYAVPALPAIFEIRRAARRGPLQGLGQLVRYAFYIWLAACVSAVVWSRGEIFFLERYYGARAVGLFAVATTIASMATQGPVLFTGALMPNIASMVGSGDTAGIRQAYRFVCTGLALVLFPLCLVTAAMSPVLVPMLYGKAFSEAVIPATIMTIGSVMSFGSVTSAFIYGFGNSRFVATVGSVAAATMIAASLIIIPRYGLIGAACIHAVVQAAAILSGLVYLRYSVGFGLPLRALCRIAVVAVAASLATAGVLRIMPTSTGILCAIPVASALFIVLVKRLRVFTNDQHVLLAQLLADKALPVSSLSRIFSHVF